MKQTILVVDDEVANAEIIKDSLEDVGYEVSTAGDTSSAQTLVDTTEFSLIILDIWMPGMDGISFLRQLKERGNTTKVIMISGHAEHNDVVESMRLGAIDFIKKPISNISSIVRNALTAKTQTSPTNADLLNQPIKQARHSFEAEYFKHHLQLHDNNMAKVAEATGIERTTLYRKLKELDIKN